MLSNIRTEQDPKRKRIMLIIDDENIIDQIENNNNERFDKQSKVQPSLCMKNKVKNGFLICVVCGSSAHGYNFGAIVCESCKAFFRRNARKNPINLHCNNNGDCSITLETRRNCIACRLAKCFKNGMKCDTLSTAEQRALKYRQIENNRNLALNSIHKINEEEHQLSSSTFSDDLFSSIDTNILFTDFTSLLLSQSQQTLLTLEDLQRVETISHFYQKRIEFANRDGLPWDPLKHTKNFLEFVSSRSISIMRLLSFFKQIPEFNQLNIDDKITLIKYNLPIIVSISTVLYYNRETNQFIENDSDIPINTQYFQVLHDYKIRMKIEKIFSSFLKIVQYDRKIIELTIIILLFTKGFSIIIDYNEHILKDYKSVYCAQNYYIELLWKYMETIHGYQKAINLFSELILHAMSWQTIQEQMRNDVLRVLSPEDITQLPPIIKSISHVE